MTRIPSNGHHLILLCRIHQVVIILKTPLAVFCILVARQDAYAVVGTEFTDNHRHALVHKSRLHFAKLVIHTVAGAGVTHGIRPSVVSAVVHNIVTSREIVARAPVILRLHNGAPIGRLVHERVSVGIVVMHLHHQAVFNLIFRKLIHRHDFAAAVHAG